MCGANFTLEHVLSCPHGGSPSIHHNEIRDITANLLTEFCNDVCVEQDLQEVTTEELSGRSAITTEEARLDIAANTFSVCNPYAPSNKNTTLEKCFRKHELEKKRAYDQRVRKIEQASFTPLVLSASGGFATEATNFYKRLASLLGEKWDHSYN